MREITVEDLLVRVQQLEQQVDELSRRTAGQQMIGPGLYPSPGMPDTSRLDNWPPVFVLNIDDIK